MKREITRGTSVSNYNWPTPLRAPHSITFNIGKYLEGHFKVKFYDWTERMAIKPENGDILLGHLSRDRRTIMWKSIKDARFSKKYLINPYSNDEAQVGFKRDGLKLSDGYIAIGGDYWVENFDESPLKEFEQKIFHLNMAVNPLNYPVVKKEFNPPGKRRFLYIGRKGRYGDEKGIGLLEELAKSIPDFQGGYICVGTEIRGWKKISSPTELNQEIMETIASEFDIFINMSRADAQATTILEAMSWGFPIACTNQSGYSREKCFFNLSLEDMKQNIKTINKIQNLSDDELKAISVENRKIVENKYSWDVFLKKLDNFIRSK